LPRRLKRWMLGTTYALVPKRIGLLPIACAVTLWRLSGLGTIYRKACLAPRPPGLGGALLKGDGPCWRDRLLRLLGRKKRGDN
jgi:hypothetical protein